MSLHVWIAADTIRFQLDGQLERATHFHQLEESTDTQAVLNDWEWMGWVSGYFRQRAGNVAVAWGYVTPPTDAQYADTLIVGRDTLVRRAGLPPSCALFPAGRDVEWRYARR